MKRKMTESERGHFLEAVSEIDSKKYELKKMISGLFATYGSLERFSEFVISSEKEAVARIRAEAKAARKDGNWTDGKIAEVVDESCLIYLLYKGLYENERIGEKWRL